MARLRLETEGTMKNQATNTNTNTNTFNVPSPWEMGCLTLVQQMNWDLVVRCLHYSGGCYATLDEYTRRNAWLLADGFGKCDFQTISQDLCWDWSHVRDSSPKAVAEMAALLRRAGFEDEGF